MPLPSDLDCFAEPDPEPGPTVLEVLGYGVILAFVLYAAGRGLLAVG